MPKAPLKRSPFVFNFLIFTSLLAYVMITYFTERFETLQLITIYLFLFAAYLWFIQCVDNKEQLRFLIFSAILFRVVHLMAVPNLSDDVFRFIWDGRLLSNGINPFEQLPTYYLEQSISIPGINSELYQALNSPNYFTIYPPVNQFIFLISATVFPESILGSIILIRVFIIAVDIAFIYLLMKLLRRYALSGRNVVVYALNPLVIIELSGNLHFEGMMMFFLMFSFYYLKKRQKNYSAIAFALSICTKLIPIIGLSLIIRRLKEKSVVYFFIVGVTCLILFLPILDLTFLKGFASSLGLYFQKFEFNASIYYIIREIGYLVVGYNIIAQSGIWLATISFLLIISFTVLEGFMKYRLTLSMLIIWTIYLFFATTVHPWYIVPLISLTIFTPYRYSIVWSLLVFFTYANYQPSGFKENLWLVVFEYIVLVAVIIWELKKHPISLQSRENRISA